MSYQIDIAVAAARRAGEAILQFYGRPLPHDTKADESPLTQADLASDQVISNVLQGETGIPILSEESDPFRTERAGWSTFWCVDPLDGTKEFIKGAAGPPAKSGEFTVNIALIEGGRPTLGVVHVPVREVTYWADEGVAWKQEGGGSPRQIRVRSAPDDRLVVVASRDHAGPEVEAILGRIRASGREVELTSMGSSLKFCLVAEGAADFYPRTVPTFEWDTAAAQAVLEAAGGRLGTREADRLAYNKEDLRNPSVFAWGDPDLNWRRWLPTD